MTTVPVIYDDAPCQTGCYATSIDHVIHPCDIHRPFLEQQMRMDVSVGFRKDDSLKHIEKYLTFSETVIVEHLSLPQNGCPDDCQEGYR